MEHEMINLATQLDPEVVAGSGAAMLGFLGKIFRPILKVLGLAQKTPTLKDPRTDQKTQARIEEENRERLRKRQGAAANVLFEDNEDPEAKLRRKTLGGV